MTIGAAAVVSATGLALWIALAAETATGWGCLAIGVLAVLTLAVGLAAGWPSAIPVALALLGAEYAVFLGVDGIAVDARAPLVAAALLMTAELAYWSLELRAAIAEEAGAIARRVAFVTLLALLGMLLGAVMLALVDAAGGEGLWLEALGAAAALAALVLVLGLARRTA
ncbi:MAG TPA: hypothetical protein VH950_00585 [Gaiellaceae bacterium]